MYQAPPTKTKSLMGTSDLTLTAPIKIGFAPAFDARSYQSRLRILLATLSAGRTASQEAQPTPLIEDAIDRIRAIHSFRLAIVGDTFRPQLLLAVTFDGGWEPYMRRIWRDLGPLLDVIFCNCEGYLSSRSHSYAQYIAWVRSAQVATEFVFTASPLTVNDLHYFRDQARGPRPAPPAPTDAEVLAQAWPALTALYRLADMYLPQGSPQPHDDADVLLIAAQMLLDSTLGALRRQAAANAGRTPSEQAALQWIAGSPLGQPAAVASSSASLQPDKVQGGIVDQYPDMTHGALLLVELKDAAAACALLEYLDTAVTRASEPIPLTGPLPKPCVNVAFTLDGLRVAGVQAGTLEEMPVEFREGMAARASILGDHEGNHPTRWSLPRINWPLGTQAGPVELTSVHAIVQFATRETLPAVTYQDFFTDAAHPLRAAVAAFSKLSAKGVRILCVQPTQRYLQAPRAPTYGHFGYVDGLSQPVVGGVPPAGPAYPNHVPLGDVLLGHENSLGDPPCRGRLWDNSSFVVIRKLSQDVEAFHAVVKGSPLPAAETQGLLMGRTLAGDHLLSPAPNGANNRFDYSSDATGDKCPFQSHVRRANPRTTRPDLKTVPRIIRRGMSFGPRFDPQKPDQQERGLMFMAYNASITEQFEVIQGWLSGANASHPHTYSALRDPFVGVCAADDPRRFDFAGGSLALGAKPLVALQWGLYAFVPSIAALNELMLLACDAADAAKAVAAAANKASACPYHLAQTDRQRKGERTVLAMKGAAVIKGLQLIERQLGIEAARTQWKVALEDFGARMSGASRAVWAAVRELHGGVLRTPYGVLVCERRWVRQVYENTGGHYTVAGYNERLGPSIGEIYLGLDDKALHDAADSGVNAAIYAVTERQAFDVAFQGMTDAVRSFLPSDAGEEVSVEVKDLVDRALAEVCKPWFGIPDGASVVPGGWSIGSTQVTCPGNFHPPSRYTFQPHPGPEITAAGRAQGLALRNAVTQLAQNNLGAIKGSRLGGPIEAAAVAATAAAPGNKNDLLVRNLVGAMMGMLPTVDGNLRGALYEWVKDASLWDHQLHYRKDASAARLPYQRAVEALRRPLTDTLQLRPAPELVWRTVGEPHNLGEVALKAGDTVVVSIVSATQQNLLREHDDPHYDASDDGHPLWPVFGGLRDDENWPNEPLHACPGYKMAMGTLLGLLAGLLESHTLRPTLSPTTLKLAR